MEFLPIFARLTNKPVLVVGGGDVAYRKVQSLLQANAAVTVVAPRICEELVAMAPDKLTLLYEEFHAALVKGKRLVIAATEKEEVNQSVFKAAEQANVLVNVVDDPQRCQFVFPSIVDRSPMIIAISTGGSAPVLGRIYKEKLEQWIPRYTGAMAQLAGSFRSQVKQTLNDFKQRRHFWESALRSKLSVVLASGDMAAAHKEMQHQLDNWQGGGGKGHVHLVGGGPGDPDLLTIKALQIMQRSDVIVYDHLISPEVLALCRKDAEFISVGKKAGNHSVAQMRIHKILIEQAKMGKQICRLKGGDPFIFGRGGEEAQALVEENIDFSVVPGITAASACAASAAIPLTHRDHAQSVQFITGHCKINSASSVAGEQPDWASLAQSKQTLVVYMGIIRSADVKSNLIEHGRSPNTPVAIIENGSRPEQRVVTGILSELDDLVAREQIGSPALIIIGDVVKVHAEIVKKFVAQLY
jgi:uroporphyrin-III C-methyltransferase/precorrin-2 dehydrogenase/sirohydrochlorin ferrochelatase